MSQTIRAEEKRILRVATWKSKDGSEAKHGDHGPSQYTCDDHWNFNGMCRGLIDSCLVGGGGMGEGEQGNSGRWDMKGIRCWCISVFTLSQRLVRIILRAPKGCPEERIRENVPWGGRMHKRDILMDGKFGGGEGFTVSRGSLPSVRGHIRRRT